MQRRFLNAGLNAPLLARVSERALIMRLPTFGSFAHSGTSPQWKASMRRTPPSAWTTNTSFVGATFQLLSRVSSGTPSAPK